MSVVSLKIGGKDYQVACDDGQEEHLRRLGDEIDERVRSLTYNQRNPPSEAMALVMASLMLADELFDKQQEIGNGAGVDDTLQLREQEARMAEMEEAMASTLEEIAIRIEKIADQIEVG